MGANFYDHNIKTMQFNRIITDQDIDTLVSFLEQHKDNSFVKKRWERNVIGSIQKITKDAFWKHLIACLLTTQQRSGPQSKITQFIGMNPFPLEYDQCIGTSELSNFSLAEFKKFGGIRRIGKISDEIENNLKYLENGGWDIIISTAEKLIESRNQAPSKTHIQLERDACLLLQGLKGIGPKQSRNLRQSLGLLRYEIPIDSRIIKRLNKNGFPFVLSPTGLSDENYYQLLTGGIQERCLETRVLPCMFDASVFASFDPDTWDEKNNIR